MVPEQTWLYEPQDNRCPQTTLKQLFSLTHRNGIFIPQNVYKNSRMNTLAEKLSLLKTLPSYNTQIEQAMRSHRNSMQKCRLKQESLQCDHHYKTQFTEVFWLNQILPAPICKRELALLVREKYKCY